MSSPLEDSRDNGTAKKKQQPPQPLQKQQQQQPQQQQQQQPQQQQPHSHRDRRRRGPPSPLAMVFVDPPSLEQTTPDGSTVSVVDSLSLALAELRGSLQGPANFFEAHERVERGAPDSSSGGNSAGSEASNGVVSPDDLLSVRPLAKRSSSLKSKKTPPGTPSQVKKAVRFADAFGLELINVKHVLDPDNPPEIPPQATSDLELGDGTESEDNDATGGLGAPSAGIRGDSQQQRLQTVLRPMFSQPGHSAGFNARVMAQKVVLESASYAPVTGEIRGYIRVANLAFEKSVTVRASVDAWRSSVEIAAEYVPNSSSSMTDQFAFCLALPGGAAAVAGAPPGTYRVTFCIVYCTCGQTFWDNNFGENYTFDAVFDDWSIGL